MSEIEVTRVIHTSEGGLKQREISGQLVHTNGRAGKIKVSEGEVEAILQEFEQAQISQSTTSKPSRTQRFLKTISGLISTPKQVEPVIQQKAPEENSKAGAQPAPPVFSQLVLPPRELLQDEWFPGFHVERLIDTGSMCEVYLCKQIRTGALVAAKTIRTEVLSTQSKLLLREEASKINKLLQASDLALPVRNLFPNFAFELIGANRFVILEEYIPLGFLEHIKGMNLEQTLQVFHNILLGVEAIHKHIGLHGDIKPEAFCFTLDGVPKFIDLSLKWGEQLFQSQASLIQSLDREKLDDVKSIQGTAPYMAPEQWEGKATVRSDVYALSLLLEAMLDANKHPAKELREIISRGKARDAEGRFESVVALRQKLGAANPIKVENISVNVANQAKVPQAQENFSIRTKPKKASVISTYLDPALEKIFTPLVPHSEQAKLIGQIKEALDRNCLDALQINLSAGRLINLSELNLILKSMPRKINWGMTGSEGKDFWKEIACIDSKDSEILEKKEWFAPIDLQILLRAIIITYDCFGIQNFNEIVLLANEIAECSILSSSQKSVVWARYLVKLNASLLRLRERLIAHDATSLKGYNPELANIIKNAKTTDDLLFQFYKLVKNQEELSLADLLCIIGYLPYANQKVCPRSSDYEPILSAMKEFRLASEFPLTCFPAESYVLWTALRKTRTTSPITSFSMPPRFLYIIKYGQVKTQPWLYPKEFAEALIKLFEKEEEALRQRLKKEPELMPLFDSLGKT